MNGGLQRFTTRPPHSQSPLQYAACSVYPRSEEGAPKAVNRPPPPFNSLRYHNLNPNYIHDRLKQLGKAFTLRVLLVQVDVVSFLFVPSDQQGS
ncbi:ERCC1 protein, partial [Polypterus senegalus]